MMENQRLNVSVLINLQQEFKMVKNVTWTAMEVY